MSETTVKDVLAAKGWKSRGPAVREGSATRQPILVSGEEALLYAFSSPVATRRAATVHARAGEQMFAIPELLQTEDCWLVVRQPEGEPVLDVVEKVEGHRAVPILHTLGEVVRKLHQLPCEAYCGDVVESDTDSHPRWRTFSGYVAHQLEWFSEHLRLRSFSEDEMEALAVAIGDLRHELSAFHPRNPACLCHGTLGLEHVWVDPAGREVVGLTGFEFAAQMPREADLAYLLWVSDVGADDRLTRAFYEGYGAARTMDVQRRERFYRRLVSFQALFGGRGEVAASAERLIELTSPRALR